MIKILLVDDDVEYLNLEKLFLEREDERFEISVACTVEEALDYIDNDEIDIVVSDYMMPNMDGLDFLKILRLEKSNDIPFIMLTGKGREEVAMASLNLGADRYIQKSGDARSQFGVLAQSISQEMEHVEAKRNVRDINTLLKSIRRVNQLMVKETDFNKIINGVCEILLETQGYLDVVIALVDENNEIIRPMAGTGEHDKRRWFITPDGKGDAPRCIKDAIGSRKTTIIGYQERYCNDCKYFQAGSVHQTVIMPIFSKDKIVGILFACKSTGHDINDSELELLDEVAGDIGFIMEKFKAEKLLKEKEKKFRTLINKSSEVIMLIDENLDIYFISDSIKSVLDRDPKDILDQSAIDLIEELVHKEDVEGFTEALKECIQDEKHVLRMEVRYMHNDGTWHWIEAEGRNRLSDPVVKGVVINFRDITYHKLSEENVRKMNQFLTALNKYSLEVTTVPVSYDIFTIISHKLRELIGAKVLILSIFDEDTFDLVVRHITLSEENNEKITDLLGRRAEDLRIKVTPEMYENLTYEIVGDIGTAQDATFCGMSEPIDACIRKLFRMQWSIGIALMHEGTLIGVILIYGDEDTKKPDSEELKAFASVTSNAIHRWMTEKKLIKSKR